jgi:hypothetical protein
MKKIEGLVVLFVIVAVLFRLVPHPPNFTPVTSMALFSGVFFKRKYLSILVPLITMVVSDMFLGFYSISIWVYAGFILVTMLGWITKQIQLHSVLLSSLIFFIVSNFGVWVLGYEHTLNGLVACYILAIPFFGYSLVGDLFWSFTLSKSFTTIKNKITWIA